MELIFFLNQKVIFNKLKGSCGPEEMKTKELGAQ